MATVKVDFKEIEQLCNELEKELKSCKGVQVGWLKGEKALNHEREQTDIEQGEVVVKLDFGNPEDRIPPRPFVRNAINGNKSKEYERALKLIFEKELPLSDTLIQFGEVVKNNIQKNIDSNMPPPNTPATIERKGSSHTLIDTGHMRNSIQVQIMTGNDDE